MSTGIRFKMSTRHLASVAENKHILKTNVSFSLTHTPKHARTHTYTHKKKTQHYSVFLLDYLHIEANFQESIIQLEFLFYVKIDVSPLLE